MVRIAPLLTVTEPEAFCVRFPAISTDPVPVVAIMTASPALGTTLPTQVLLFVQVPPVVVLVIVAPKTLKPSNINTIAGNRILRV